MLKKSDDCGDFFPINTKIPPQHAGAGFVDGFNEILVMIPEELAVMKESSHHIPSQFEFF